MRDMTVRSVLLYISLTIIILASSGTSHAKIDLESCIGAWLFDEGKGDMAKDSSGKGNDGKINGAKWAEGKIGKALEFDGATSRVDIPDSDILNNVKEITILAWVYLRREVTSGTWNSLAGKNPYPNGYLIWIQVPREPCGLVYVGGQRFDDRPGIQIDLKKWYHIAFTRAADGKMKLYIDGKMVKEAQSAAGPISTKPGPLAIGGQSPQILDGFVDDVIIFNTVLKDDDINNIMTKSLMGAIAVSISEKLATTWSYLKTE